MSKAPREAERIAVIGLGYVGLPVAVAFAHRFPVIGYDIDATRVAALGRGEDWTGEVAAADFEGLKSLALTDNPADLAGATVFIIAVPTPVDGDRQPDLGALLQACDAIGPALAPGSLVVVESTVYPGVTEETLRAAPGGRLGPARRRDFTLGYSPERINPGDREHGWRPSPRWSRARTRPPGSRRGVYGRSWKPVSIGRRRSRWPRPPR